VKKVLELAQPSCAPSAATEENVQSQRDPSWYSPCSNFFILEANKIFASSFHFPYLPEGEFEISSQRFLVNWRKFFSESSDMSSCLGYCSNLNIFGKTGMHEKGATSFLCGELIYCYNLVCAREGINGSATRIQHQSAAGFKGDRYGFIDVALYQYLTLSRRHGNSELLPTSLIEVTNGVDDIDLTAKRPQNSAYANSMFQQTYFYETGELYD